MRILDVRGLTDVTDFMVLATGTSERHLKAMAAAVEAVAREEGRTLLGVEGAGPSGWIVVDAADVVAHLFSRSLRSYYDLDGLWADAASVDGQAKVASPGGEARSEAARGRDAQGEDAQGEDAQREDAPGEDAPGGGPDEGAAG